jgi:integrase
MPIDDLVDRIKGRLAGDRFHLDFIAYTRKKAADMNPGTASTYVIMLSALQRFIKRDHLDIAEITTAFLRDFEKFIEVEPSQQGCNRKTEKKDIKPKSGRAVSAYLACVRAIHNKAKAEFNDEDRGVIRIPFSPFKNYKIKPQPKTRKRGLTPETLQAIIDLPYEKESASRLNLAKDCFILSFALIGMNSADMYYAEPVKRKTLIYNRRKTAGRRDDKAEMRVRIDSCLTCLMEKYADPQGKRLFNFYARYTTPFTFNKALNTGLKRIGGRLGIEGLEFYAARHSWATVARSSDVGIDKATVHEALNHVSGSLAITDIYIDRDWSVIWNANKKVLALFDWSAIGFDVL